MQQAAGCAQLESSLCRRGKFATALLFQALQGTVHPKAGPSRAGLFTPDGSPKLNAPPGAFPVTFVCLCPASLDISCVFPRCESGLPRFNLRCMCRIPRVVTEVMCRPVPCIAPGPSKGNAHTRPHASRGACTCPSPINACPLALCARARASAVCSLHQTESTRLRQPLSCCVTRA